MSVEREENTCTITFDSAGWRTDAEDVFTVTDGAVPFYGGTTWSYDEKPTLRSGQIDHNGVLVGEESAFAISNITVKDSATSSRSGLMLSICVSNGYLYIISYDRKSLYKVNLSNTVDVKELTFDENQLWYIYPMYGGGLYAQFSFPVKTSTGETKTYYDMGIIYPDGKYRVNTQSVSSVTTLSMDTYAAFETERIMRLRAGSIGFDRRYLGTICNLSSPVVKTSAQSMKVTYTLTDV